DAYYLMYSIAPAAGEGCVVAATRYDSEIQNQERDVYLVGLGPDGLITSTEVDSTAINTILLYPNPGDNKIMIDTDSKKFTFKLYNPTGKKILQSSNQKTIDVSRLEAGMYFYRVISQGEIIGSGKWVKQ
ncbi:MAG: T9SS type A sorting domain-containing protein, partial [Bacteroidales bacterium]|nr:T9SS type A sorting domain-containing protein [Bacteroidales bacterium]